MAALDFPNPPLTVGQQYAAPNGITYQWDGAAWIMTGGPPMPYARVYRAANFQSIATGAATNFTYDTIASNVGGMYAAGSPDRFTIVVGGFYLVGGNVQIADSAAGNGRQMYFNVNGSTVVQHTIRPGTYCYGSMATALTIAASSYVQFGIYQDSGVALTATSPNFWIARLT